MPRPDVRDERIPQILNAAATIFAQHGVDGSSMNQVAIKSGLSKATIYHYFRSKTEMVDALVERLFSADEAEVEALKNGKGSALDRLVDYTSSLASLLKTHDTLFPIVAEFKALACRSDSVQQVLSGYFARYITAFELVLAQGKAEEEIRSEIDCEDCAMALVALIEGSILLANNSKQDLERLLKSNVGLFLKGLEC